MQYYLINFVARGPPRFWLRRVIPLLRSEVEEELLYEEAALLVLGEPEPHRGAPLSARDGHPDWERRRIFGRFRLHSLPNFDETC